MKMIRNLIGLFLVSMLAGAALAQSATVTATITTAWAGGTVVANFIRQGAGKPQSTQTSANINASGSFTINDAWINTSAQFKPSLTQFTICVGKPQTCYTTTATITTSPQDISASFSSAPTPPSAGGVSQIVAGSNITISPAGGTGSVTVSASGTVGTAFSAVTSGTNTNQNLVCGAGCVLTPSGGGDINANEINGTALSGLATGIVKNTTSTGVPSIATAGTDYVSPSTTVNGHALSSNVVVSASDLTTGTLPHAQLPTLLSADIPNNAANTSGNAATSTNISTNGLANQVWGMNTGATAQGWQTVSGSGVTLSTNGTNNASQTALNFITSTTNATGLTVTPSNSTSTEKFEVTGTINAGNVPTLNQSTTGNAATATALASVPSQCTGGQFATGVAASGNANCGTPAGSGNVSAGGTLTSNAVVIGQGTQSVATISADTTTTHALFATAGAPAFRAIATGDIPTLNQSTTGNAATATTATNVAGGSVGTIHYQSAANTTAMLAANTAATDQVVVSHGSGSAGLAPTLSNAPALSAANMASFPTLNQNTTGTAAGLTSYPTLCSGGQFSQGLSSGSNNCGTPIGSGTTFQTNGTGLSSSTTVNFLNSNATNGLTLTFANPSAGGVQLGLTGTLSNAGLANSSITIAGTSVALGGSTTSLPSPGAIGGTTPSSGAFTTVTASAGFTSTGDGTHAGIASVVGNTTVPSLPTNNFSIIGPNSASFTAFAWQAPTATNGSAGLVHVGANSSGVSQLTVSGVAVADLTATGTPSSTTFLRGDNTWATPSGGSSSFPETVSGTTTSGGIPYFSSTTTLTSSAILNTNVLVKGGGAGGAPTNSSITDNGTTVSTTEPLATTSTLSVGSSPPACTAGTAGAQCFTEGTAFTNVSGTGGIYADSTAHEFLAKTNGASAAGMINRSQPGAIRSTGLTASVTTATLCAASAGACNTAGTYHVHVALYQTGTACTANTTNGVGFSLTWTDANGTTHSAQPIPLETSATITAGVVTGTMPWGATTVSGWGSGDFNIDTNGTIIQYATVFAQCTTGTATYALSAVVTRLQ
jgi:hypothetical protein